MSTTPGSAGALTSTSWTPPGKQGRVLVSADTDFGELLARQHTGLPSLVLFRQGNRAPEHHADTLLGNLDEIVHDLEAGAIVVFTNDSIRIRKLPFIT